MMKSRRGKREEDLLDGTESGPDGEEQTRAESVADLFRAHNQALVRFLVLRLQSVQEAREVAQEAYVRLLQLDKPALGNFMRAYLFRIASNIAIDRLRRRQSENRMASRELFDELDYQQEPERRTAAQQELEVIQDCLEELPENCRDAFLLHRLDGLSVADIAERLNVSGRMVRHHLQRALVYCQLRIEGATAEQARQRMKR